MDSRSGFSLMLVITGLVVVWLAFTGHAQDLIAKLKGSTTSNSPGGSTTPSKTVSMSDVPTSSTLDSPPAAATSSSPTVAMNAGGVTATVPASAILQQQISYANLLGTDGVKAVPYAGAGA